MVIFKNGPSVSSLSLIHCHLSAASPNHNLISTVTMTPTAVHQLQRLCRTINPYFRLTDHQLKLDTVTWINVVCMQNRLYHERGHESLFMIWLQVQQGDREGKFPVSPICFCAERVNTIFRQPFPRK